MVAVIGFALSANADRRCDNLTVRSSDGMVILEHQERRGDNHFFRVRNNSNRNAHVTIMVYFNNGDTSVGRTREPIVSRTVRLTVPANSVIEELQRNMRYGNGWIVCVGFSNVMFSN